MLGAEVVFKVLVSLAVLWQVTLPWADLGVQISSKHLWWGLSHCSRVNTAVSVDLLMGLKWDGYTQQEVESAFTITATSAKASPVCKALLLGVKTRLPWESCWSSCFGETNLPGPEAIFQLLLRAGSTDQLTLQCELFGVAWSRCGFWAISICAMSFAAVILWVQLSIMPCGEGCAFQ